MKAKNVAVWMSLVFAGLAGTGVLLAQKASTPSANAVLTSDDGPAVMAMPDQIDRKMILMGGESEGSWLGVELSDVTAEKAKELKLPGEYGAIVQSVREESPAAKAGLEKGDVILSFAGENVISVVQLGRLVRETPPGRTVSIEASRGGRTRTLTAKLAARPEAKWVSHFEMPHVEIPDVHIPNFDFNMMFVGGPRLGISADELTPQLADYFGVKQGKGVLVREVEDGTPAQKAGLKAGDVIVKIGDKEIASISDLRRALRPDSDEKQKVTLTLIRDRKEQTVSVELEAAHRMIGPRDVAELKNLGISPEEMSRLKAEVDKAAREVRVDKEKIKAEVQRALKDHQQELDRAKREIESLRREGLFQLI
jgi:serine protease Do